MAGLGEKSPSKCGVFGLAGPNSMEAISDERVRPEGEQSRRTAVGTAEHQQ
jgi:hypothetical protein